jgi:hypothetical protein
LMGRVVFLCAENGWALINKECVMASQVAAEKLAEAMEAEMREYLSSVMQAVNEAPDGAWIAGSEERVRDLSAEFRRKLFERAVQLRVDAAEAAFSPSAGSGER